MSAIRLAEIGDERGDAASEVVEPVGELALRRTLVDVRVPAADIRERDLEADVGLDELRDLSERLAERRARVVGAVLRLILRRVGDLQHLHRVERVSTGAAQNPIGGRGVLRFE